MSNSTTTECLLTVGAVWPLNFWSKSCNVDPRKFVDEYRLVSLFMASFYVASFLLHCRNAALRVAKNNYAINSSNSALLTIEVLCICASLCGMTYYSNMSGYHYFDYCIAYMAVDVRSGLMLIVGYAYIKNTRYQVISFARSLIKETKGGGGENGEVIRKLKEFGWNWGSLAPTLILIVGSTVPRYIMCTNNSNPRIQHLAIAVMLFVYCTFLIYLLFGLRSIMVTCTNVIVAIQTKAVKSIRSRETHDKSLARENKSKVTKRDEGEIEIGPAGGDDDMEREKEVFTQTEINDEFKKWKSLYTRYAVYSVFVFLSLCYASMNVVTNISSSAPMTEDPKTIGSIMKLGFVPSYITKGCLFWIAYFNHVNASFLRENLSVANKANRTKKIAGLATKWDNWIVVMSYIFVAIASIPTVLVSSMIYNNFAIEIQIYGTYFGISVFIAAHLLFKMDWSRKEEISACSNSLQGRNPTPWNYFLILLEHCSFIVLAFDNLFMQWSPRWVQDVTDTLFSMVSLDKYSTWSSQMTPGDSETISIVLFSLLMLFILFFILMPFFHLPKVVVVNVNRISYLMFDIALMPIMSFIMKRVQCTDIPLVINGSNPSGDVLMMRNNHNGTLTTDSDVQLSLYFSGSLYGFTRVSCDRGWSHILHVAWSFMLIAGMSMCGMFYMGFVRNKAAEPRVRDIPAFSTLKFASKTAITLAIATTYERNALTPWIRVVVNCLCVSAVTVASIMLRPVLGPSSNRVNTFRTYGYSVAQGFNLGSLAIIVMGNSSHNSKDDFAPLIAFATLPILTCVGTALAIRKLKRFDNSKSVQALCNGITSKGSYDEKMGMAVGRGSREGEVRTIEFAASLLISSSPDFAMEIEAQLTRVAVTIQIECNANTATNAEPGPLVSQENSEVLECLKNATYFSVGLKVVNRKCAVPVMNIIVSTLKIVYQVSDVIESQQVGSRDADIFVGKRMKQLAPLLSNCFETMSEIASNSVHYQHELLKMSPLLMELLVSIQNNLLYIGLWKHKSYHHEMEWTDLIESLFCLISNLKSFDDAGIDMLDDGASPNSGFDESSFISDSTASTVRSTNHKRCYHCKFMCSPQFQADLAKLILFDGRRPAGKGESQLVSGRSDVGTANNVRASAALRTSRRGSVDDLTVMDGRKSAVIGPDRNLKELNKDDNQLRTPSLSVSVPQSPLLAAETYSPKHSALKLLFGSKVSPQQETVSPTILQEATHMKDSTSNMKSKQAGEKTKVMQLQTVRGLRRKKSLCLLESDSSFIESRRRVVVDGVILIVDLQTLDVEPTSESIMKLIDEIITDLLDAGNNPLLIKAQDEDIELFLSVGIFDLEENVRLEVMSVWQTMAKASKGKSKGSRQQGKGRGRLVHDKVKLSLLPVDRRERGEEDPEGNLDMMYLSGVLSVYALLERAISDDIDRYRKEVAMWKANGVKQ